MIDKVRPVYVKPGDRIQLLSMPDDPDPIDIGSQGTVFDIYPQPGWLQIDVDWDDGRKLMLTVPPDRLVIVG